MEPSSDYRTLTSDLRTFGIQNLKNKKLSMSLSDLRNEEPFISDLRTFGLQNLRTLESSHPTKSNLVWWKCKCVYFQPVCTHIIIIYTMFSFFLFIYMSQIGGYCRMSYIYINRIPPRLLKSISMPIYISWTHAHAHYTVISHWALVPCSWMNRSEIDR